MECALIITYIAWSIEGIFVNFIFIINVIARDLICLYKTQYTFLHKITKSVTLLTTVITDSCIVRYMHASIYNFEVNMNSA